MPLKPPPVMSVVLPLAGDFRSLRLLLMHLRTQTDAHRLELVFVVWNRELSHFNPEVLEPFHSYKILQMHGQHTRGEIFAAGVWAASAPLVALSENHAFPQPGWSRALIKAHEGPWAAVGPVILNGHSGSNVDLACSITLYAPWLQREKGREMDDLPGSNSSYKRSVLLEYGSDLARLLDNHTLLHWDLRRKGRRLWMEAGARLLHYEYDEASMLLAENLRTGHRFAANRAKNWGASKRLLYTLGSPLIPLVRITRILLQLRGSSISRAAIVKVLPLILAALGVSAFGEMKGYLTGYQDLKQKQVDYELWMEKRMVKRAQRLP